MGVVDVGCFYFVVFVFLGIGRCSYRWRLTRRGGRSGVEWVGGSWYFS